MFKTLVFGFALAAGIGGSVAVSQAREYSAWGHTFTTDDGNGSGINFAPAPSKDFNAVVAQPHRYRVPTQRLNEEDLR